MDCHANGFFGFTVMGEFGGEDRFGGYTNGRAEEARGKDLSFLLWFGLYVLNLDAGNL